MVILNQTVRLVAIASAPCAVADAVVAAVVVGSSRIGGADCGIDYALIDGAYLSLFSLVTVRQLLAVLH